MRTKGELTAFVNAVKAVDEYVTRGRTKMKTPVASCTACSDIDGKANALHIVTLWNNNERVSWDEMHQALAAVNLALEISPEVTGNSAAWTGLQKSIQSILSRLKVE